MQQLLHFWTDSSSPSNQFFLTDTSSPPTVTHLILYRKDTEPFISCFHHVLTYKAKKKPTEDTIMTKYHNSHNNNNCALAEDTHLLIILVLTLETTLISKTIKNKP